jgi:hypothetical protein
MLIRTREVTAAVVAVLAVTGRTGALASSRGPDPSCVSHRLTATPIGHITMVDSYVDNECGSEGPLSITYRALGPCPHASTVDVTVAPGAWDVVTFYTGPCEGHYLIRQRLVSGGTRVGQDTAEFDAPG